MTRYILHLLLLIGLSNGCLITDECMKCTNNGCYFVTLDTGVICLASIDGVIGYISVVTPFASEYCDSPSTSVLPTSATTTTISPTTTAAASTFAPPTTTPATSTTTIIFTSTMSSTTTMTPATETPWVWIIPLSIFFFILFLLVAFFLFNRAKLAYQKHHDQLEPHDIL